MRAAGARAGRGRARRRGSRRSTPKTPRSSCAAGKSCAGRSSTPTASPIRFAHVFVDEVQDASPLELRVLLELTGKERCITLAGDVAQRMLDEGDDRGEFDWNALLDGLGVAHTTIEPLKVSYRSTAEITHFARSILGPLSHDDVPETTRRGPPVELFAFASAGEAVGVARRGAQAARARRARRQRGARRAVPPAGGPVLRGPVARGGPERAPRIQARLLVGAWAST